MREQLIQAIKDRLDRGYDVAQIRRDVLAAGHDEAVFTDALAAARAAVSDSDPDPATVVNESGAPEAAPSTTDAQPTDAGASQLIGYGALPLAGARLAWENRGAVAAYMFSVLLLGGVTTAAFFFIGNYWFSSLLSALSTGDEGRTVPSAGLVFTLMLLLFLSSVLLWRAMGIAFWRRVLLRRYPNVGYWGSIGWVLIHIWSLALTLLAVRFAVAGASLFLLIPGILLLLYAQYALPVYLTEGSRGVTAIVRSFHLVHRHFWSLTGRAALAAVVVAVSLGAAALAVFALASTGTAAALIGWLLATLLVVGSLVWSVFVWIILFESVRSIKPVDTFSTDNFTVLKVVLYICIILGVLSPVLPLMTAFPTSVSPDDLMETVAVPEAVLATVEFGSQSPAPTPSDRRQVIQAELITEVDQVRRTANATTRAATSTTGWEMVCGSDIMERVDQVATLRNQTLDCSATTTAYRLFITLPETASVYCVDSRNTSQQLPRSVIGTYQCDGSTEVLPAASSSASSTARRIETADTN